MEQNFTEEKSRHKLNRGEMYRFVFDKNTINAQKLGEYLLYLKE